MQTIGLLGGMSWESTQTYYQAINQGVRKHMGGLHSAEIVLYSVDFQPIERLLVQEDWDGITESLSKAALKIQSAGADFLLICTNTMHQVAPQVQSAIGIPIIHIADATGEVLANQGITKIGLLGTAFTMEHDFYKGHIRDKFGMEVLIPDDEDRRIIHDVIFKELCLGNVAPRSKSQYLRIIDGLADKGAQGIVLGCTEIGMLVDQKDTNVRLFDTTVIHAEKAVELAVKEEIS